ncbi:unnamed protein product [Peronospora destructor]|uniref:Protein kinase domain-containing protein n=1 Tax=Peronospora destructor TaxID=86335 RepID=A0AAV0TEG2_9STRA|nr:unnamed protein product [Peronospora destructor]
MIRQKYRLKCKISSTLYGAVCACEDTHNSNELVAIKQVSLNLAASILKAHPNVDNPWHEKRAINKLLELPPHPNLVHFYEEFLHNESWFVVMEFCPEGDLWDRMQCSPNGQVPEKEALRLFREVTRGLHYLHTNGVAHRDVSLENVLLRNGVCKIADLGLATDAERTCKNEMVGKAYYMAPVGCKCFLQLGIRRVVCAWQISSFISNEACDLMSALLQRNPIDRLTTSDVLAHPLLQ